MRNAPPPDRRVAAGPLEVDVLRHWRTFARAHGLARPEAHRAQPVPPGLLAALVTPAFVSRWMGTLDPALLIPPPAGMHVNESIAGPLDPAHALTVQVNMITTARWEAVCTQAEAAVGRVAWTWAE
jgi:hypothetical protein